MATCKPSAPLRTFLKKPVVNNTLACASAGLNVGVFIGMLVFTSSAASAVIRLFR